ncbi:MAG: hypothetical protein IPL83_05990 [Bdellovibrionales bacterium]|nr:hypothetical protein [Bdellovibrionales bacterium]
MSTSANTVAFLILTAPVWIFVVGLPMACCWMVGKKLIGLLRKLRLAPRPKLSKEDRICLMRQELRDYDTEMSGFNPMKYNYSIFELFPKQPELEVVNQWRKKIFSLSDLKDGPNEKTEKIKFWYSIFLAMALMRVDMKKQKIWTSEKEQLWLGFPYRPKAMREVDPIYFETVREKYLGNHLENREPSNKLAC